MIKDFPSCFRMKDVDVWFVDMEWKLYSHLPSMFNSMQNAVIHASGILNSIYVCEAQGISDVVSISY